MEADHATDMYIFIRNQNLIRLIQNQRQNQDTKPNKTKQHKFKNCSTNLYSHTNRIFLYFQNKVKKCKQYNNNNNNDNNNNNNNNGKNNNNINNNDDNNNNNNRNKETNNSEKK